MKKVSVIMASYLGPYPGRASNPEQKFVRAVKSFLTQTYKEKELVIVADGCDVTERIYEFNFKKYDNVKLVKIDKQPVYSGGCRNAGLDVATGEVVSYLDNDDVIGKKHLETIMESFNDDDNTDLVYYDDYLVMSEDFKKLHRRYVEPRYGSIGTSSITHVKVPWLRWTTGYGHDWIYVMTALLRGMSFKKLEKPSQYLVAHWGGSGKGDF